MESSDQPGETHPEGHGHGGWADPVGESSDEVKETTHKAFDASNAPEPGPGPEVSEEEAAGVPPDDTTGRTPLGVGESINERGENVETKGEGGTDRETDEEGDPPATRPAAERTGVNPLDA